MGSPRAKDRPGLLVATLAQGSLLPPCGGKDCRSTAAIRSAFDHRQRIMNNAAEVDVHAVISFLHHLAPLRSPCRKIPQLAKPGNGHRRYPSSGDEVDGRACPERVRVPCIDLVQRNEANNPEAHGQARKADGEAIALDAVPSPHSRPQTTKTMTTTATAMLAAICKLRRSSYQPLCLKIPRKKSPNPRSKPRPHTVFIRDSTGEKATFKTEERVNPNG